MAMDANQFRIQGADAIKQAMDTYSSSSADFFILKADNDVARVRFAHSDNNDLDIFVVHKVIFNGKEKYILCLGPANQPCPLCAAGFKATVRLFLTLDDFRDGKRKIWDRGKTEIPNILGYITRYGSLDGILYDVQRHGAKGDQDTQYQFFPLQNPPEGLPPQKPRESLVENGFIAMKSPEEITAMLQAGSIQKIPDRNQRQQPQYGYQPQPGYQPQGGAPGGYQPQGGYQQPQGGYQQPQGGAPGGGFPGSGAPGGGFPGSGTGRMF
jgi:hypothetical protein